MTGADDQPVVAGQTIGQIALVVRDYDEAIHFYVDVLGFALIDDPAFTLRGNHRVFDQGKVNAGSSWPRGVRPGHACCLRGP